MNKFILKGIDSAEILLKHYGMDSSFNKPETILEEPILEEPAIASASASSNLPKTKKNSKKLKNYIIFLDQYKVRSKYWVRMADMSGNLIPQYYSKPCWNCRSTFKSHPIGCPIEYINIELINETMKAVIFSKFKLLNLEKVKHFFITEGVFCTFPCVKNYILDNLNKSKSSKYKNSLTFLTLLYSEYTGNIETIPLPGWSWKDTIDYEGCETPENLRQNCKKLEYEELSVNIKGPFMFPISSFVKQKERN